MDTQRDARHYSQTKREEMEGLKSPVMWDHLLPCHQPDMTVLLIFIMLGHKEYIRLSFVCSVLSRNVQNKIWHWN